MSLTGSSPSAHERGILEAVFRLQVERAQQRMAALVQDPSGSSRLMEDARRERVALSRMRSQMEGMGIDLEQAMRGGAGSETARQGKETGSLSPKGTPVGTPPQSITFDSDGSMSPVSPLELEQSSPLLVDLSPTPESSGVSSRGCTRRLLGFRSVMTSAERALRVDKGGRGSGRSTSSPGVSGSRTPIYEPTTVDTTRVGRSLASIPTLSPRLTLQVKGESRAPSGTSGRTTSTTGTSTTGRVGSQLLVEECATSVTSTSTTGSPPLEEGTTLGFRVKQVPSSASPRVTLPPFGRSMCSPSLDSTSRVSSEYLEYLEHLESTPFEYLELEDLAHLLSNPRILGAMFRVARAFYEMLTEGLLLEGFTSVKVEVRRIPLRKRHVELVNTIPDIGYSHMITFVYRKMVEVGNEFGVEATRDEFVDTFRVWYHHVNMCWALDTPSWVGPAVTRSESVGSVPSHRPSHESMVVPSDRVSRWLRAWSKRLEGTLAKGSRVDSPLYTRPSRQHRGKGERDQESDTPFSSASLVETRVGHIRDNHVATPRLSEVSYLDPDRLNHSTGHPSGDEKGSQGCISLALFGSKEGTREENEELKGQRAEPQPLPHQQASPYPSGLLQVEKSTGRRKQLRVVHAQAPQQQMRQHQKLQRQPPPRPQLPPPRTPPPQQLLQL